MIFGKQRLCDWATGGGITPFDIQMLGDRPNECGIDVNLGCVATLPDEPSGDRFEYILKPGEFVLARLQQRIVMPSTAAGLLTVRSCLARQGLNQLTSVLIKPEWCGYLILELHNVAIAPISLLEVV